MEWSTASFWLAVEQYDKVSKNIKFLSYHIMAGHGCPTVVNLV
jgi:hypothetical protein